MEDNFENELKKHGDAYKVRPREWVWPRVEAELDKKKERRIAAWWWMAPLALLMLGAGYWLTNRKEVDTNLTVAPASDSKKENATREIVQAEEKTSEAASNPPTEKPVAVAANAAPKEIVSAPPATKAPDTKKATATETKNTANTVVFDDKKTAVVATKKSAVLDKAINAPVTDLSYTNIPNKITKNTTPTSSSSEEKTVAKESTLNGGQPVKQTDDLLEVPTEKNIAKQIITNQNTSDSTTAKTEETILVHKEVDTTEIKTLTVKENAPPNIAPKTKQPFKKETVWTINMGAGTTNNKNGLGLSNLFSLEKNMYDAIPQNSANPGNGSCQTCYANSLPLLSSKPGINLSLSVARSQWINSRWLWQAELGWQYQQMQQRYGGRKDSTVFYSNLSSAAYNYYYQSGSTTTNNGYNHRVFISNQIALAMLKNRALRLSVGLYGGWNIGNNYLIPDRTNFRFVDGKSLYKKAFLGGEASIRYVLKNNWFIGLNGKVDFTRSFTPPDGNNQYWKSWQLQAGIPVTNIKQLFKH